MIPFSGNYIPALWYLSFSGIVTLITYFTLPTLFSLPTLSATEEE